MAYFIIVRGPLGCGKSTITKMLAKKLKAKYISIDDVLEKNRLDDIDPKIGCIPANNFIKANEMVLQKVRRDLDGGKVVIFDACFYHKEPIEHLIKELPYKGFVFTLKAPLETCIERDRKRGKTHGETAARDVHRLVSRFDYGTVIDVTRPIEVSVNDIISYLPKK